ncbi:MAG: methyltransferase [Alphaproteobacteria bacterium]
MQSEPSAPPSRAPIDQIREAIITPLAVRAALQLGVFTPLAHGPKTAVELADVLGVKTRRLEMLLYQLVVADFLEVQDDRFANSAMADHYLVEGRPGYFGGIHELWTEMFTAQLQTADSIRTDTPRAKVDFSGMSREELGGFLRGVHGGALLAGRTLAKKPQFTKARHLADIGGGSGGVAIALCQEHPQLQATVFDLPSVVPIAQEMIAEAGLADRITVQTADILGQPLPGGFDIATARNLFQVLSADQNQKAANNIAAALPSDGAFFLVGHICDDSRLSPGSCVGMNMNFLNQYDDGEAYTETQYCHWLGEAGFADIMREPFLQGASLILASKP